MSSNKIQKPPYPSRSSVSQKIKSKLKIKVIKRIVKKGNGQIVSNKQIGNEILNKTNKLRFMSINLRKGFFDKTKQIYNEIKQNKIDIILLQEVGLFNLSKYQINRIFPGFRVFTNLFHSKPQKYTSSSLGKKRQFQAAKRGVAILVNKNLEKICTIKKIFKDQKARALFIQLQSENSTINLGNIYAPAEGEQKNKKWINKLLNVCKNKKFKQGELLIGGDWNINLLDWPDYFFDFINQLNLYDLALEKRKEDVNTYEIWKKNKKIKKRLDAWFGNVNIRKEMLDIKINKNSDIYSDHKPVYLTINWNNSKKLEENRDKMLILNNKIKKIVKKMDKKDWLEYQKKVDIEFRINEYRWDKILNSALQEKNIQVIYPVIKEGIKIMKNILFSSKKGKEILNENEPNNNIEYREQMSKKIRYIQKYKCRLLKI